jgi:hypothetical protein
VFGSEEEAGGNKNGKNCFVNFQMLAQMKAKQSSPSKSKKVLVHFPRRR